MYRGLAQEIFFKFFLDHHGKFVAGHPFDLHAAKVFDLDHAARPEKIFVIDTGIFINPEEHVGARHDQAGGSHRLLNQVRPALRLQLRQHIGTDPRTAGESYCGKLIVAQQSDVLVGGITAETQSRHHTRKYYGPYRIHS